MIEGLQAVMFSYSYLTVKKFISSSVLSFFKLTLLESHSRNSGNVPKYDPKFVLEQLQLSKVVKSCPLQRKAETTAIT
jgi:hypothetical protein